MSDLVTDITTVISPSSDSRSTLHTLCKNLLPRTLPPLFNHCTRQKIKSRGKGRLPTHTIRSCQMWRIGHRLTMMTTRTRLAIAF